jgi:gamma-glutamyl:cysteine ligase YbdK (ATP-grasp superfamily)
MTAFCREYSPRGITVVESWHDDISRLDFGVEQEQFVFRADGGVPTEAQSLAVLEALLGHGFRAEARDARGRLIGVVRDTPTGPLAMKNDFCTHIFEVSYPPASRVAAFAAQYRETDALARAVLTEQGLRVLPTAVLPRVPPGYVMRPSDSDLKMRRYRTLLARPAPARRYSHPVFFTAICATHIHANILDDAFFTRLPAYYGVEYLVPLLFPNGTLFNGLRAYSIRPLLYRDGFDDSYRAYAIPRPIPASRAEYAAFLAGATGMVRDYSFLAPSRHGTVEFRAADSQPAAEDIFALLALRVALIVAVARGDLPTHPHADARFWHACETGAVPPRLLRDDAAALRRAAALLPDDYQPHFARVERRLGRVLQRAA